MDKELEIRQIAKETEKRFAKKVAKLGYKDFMSSQYEDLVSFLNNNNFKTIKATNLYKLRQGGSEGAKK